ncbi:acyl carrier protein [Taibaiella chishuiensis]|uniref:Acyl carrier protein n=1 Tax=Taibaiella chishuiensis TaxID=1434707 RepID=A0A2P8D2P5_9BACT|nr:acyl carrier protein [Taibaiella chishuiensis]PSK91498.1 acyl carrier protein [Taibaiella chishuiensis]
MTVQATKSPKKKTATKSVTADKPARPAKAGISTGDEKPESKKPAAAPKKAATKSKPKAADVPAVVMPDATQDVVFDPELVAKMKKIIAAYTDQHAALDQITEDTDNNFIQVLHIDSVDVVEIIIDTEKEFSITIEDEEIKHLKTFKLLYLLVEQKIKAVAS